MTVARCDGGVLLYVRPGEPRYGVTADVLSDVHRFGRLRGQAPVGCPWRAPVDPIELILGSSFPADSAKPVPLAVVSLDSR